MNVFEFNRNVDHQNFSQRIQRPTKSLHQFSNVVNGLAAQCDFGYQIEGLVYDISESNMTNKQVQRSLCTEAKVNPEEALRIPVAFENELKRQRLTGIIVKSQK